MKLILFCIIMSSALVTYGQKSTFVSTYCNHVKAWSNNTGGLIQLPVYNGQGGLVINPSDDEDYPVSSIFSLATILGGYADGALKGMFITNNDYIVPPFNKFNNIPGPVENGSDYYPQYNKIWQVRSWEVLALIDDYNDNKKIDSKPSDHILSWPGRGNKYSKNYDGIIWPDRDLAPFYDQNKDGIYDPYSGDYPIPDPACPNKIPGDMNWSLYHGANANMEIQTLNFAFASDINPILNNTIFSTITIYNTNNNVKDAKFGIYFDFDLGCIKDDYIGSSSATNSVYVYNKTEIDLNPCVEPGAHYNAYREKSPMTSLTCLNRRMDGTIVYDKAANNAAATDPGSPLNFYNYISNRWLNNVNLTYGGNGYDLNSTNNTKYIYPSSPSNPSGWSMKTLGKDFIDPRGFMNFDLGTLNNGQSIRLDFAMTYHKADLTTDHFSRVDTMLSNISLIKDIAYECFDSEEHNEKCIGDCVWPGDTDHNGIVNNLDILNIGPALKSSGAKRELYADFWNPFYSDEWSKNTFQNLNYKHIDCNGSGSINQEDFNAVTNNFFSRNQTYSTWGGYNVEGNDLTFGDLEDSLKGGEEFELEMIFAKNNNFSLFGMAYSVEFDTTLLTLTDVVFEKRWLDKKSPPNFVLEKEKGKLHFGIVKNLGVNAIVHDVPLGILKFRVKDNFEGKYKTLLKYTNYEKIDADGRISELTASNKALVVANPITTIDKEFDGFLLYPNPTIEFVFIKSKEVYVKAELFDVLGVKYEFKVENNSFRAEDVPSGAYMTRLTDENGVRRMHRLIVIK